LLGGQLLWAQLDTGAAGLSTMTSNVFLHLLGRAMDESDVREYVGDDGVSLGRSPGGKQSWVARIGDVRLGRYRFDSLPFRIVPPRQDGVSMIVLATNL